MKYDIPRDRRQLETVWENASIVRSYLEKDLRGNCCLSHTEETEIIRALQHLVCFQLECLEVKKELARIQE